MGEFQEMKKRIEQVRDCKNLQCEKGQYDQNSYMCGMANGLIMALSILDKENPKYLAFVKTKKDTDPPSQEKEMKEMLDDAWGLIKSVYHGELSRNSDEWKKSADRWQRKYKEIY